LFEIYIFAGRYWGLQSFYNETSGCMRRDEWGKAVKRDFNVLRKHLHQVWFTIEHIPQNFWNKYEPTVERAAINSILDIKYTDHQRWSPVYYRPLRYKKLMNTFWNAKTAYFVSISWDEFWIKFHQTWNSNRRQVYK